MKVFCKKLMRKPISINFVNLLNQQNKNIKFIKNGEVNE